MSNMLIVARSATGLRYLRKGRSQGDDRADYWTRNGFAILVMADGAGGCPQSNIAAEAITEALGWKLRDVFHGPQLPAGVNAEACLDIALESLLERTLLQALEAAAAELQQRLKGRSIPLGDALTTICAVVMTRNWVASISVGDTVCLLGQRREWNLLCYPIKSSSHSTFPKARNATTLLPSEMPVPGVANVCVGARKPGDMVLLFTDGAYQLFLRDATPEATSGEYEPEVEPLEEMYERLHAYPALRESLARAWIEDAIRRLQQEAGEEDDISIMLALDSLLP